MISHVDPKVACSVLDGLGPYGYVHAADTARLIRSALKIAFPGVPFSVRSKSYSGGSSVDVYWTDGPSKAHVDTALAGFVGKGFDGMIDLDYSSDCYMTRSGSVGFARTGGTAGSGGTVYAADASVPCGATVVCFLSYIFTSRRYSDDHRAPDSRVDYWAWKAHMDADLPPAPAPKF